jgi:RND family efflux transporter MFP subunit
MDGTQKTPKGLGRAVVLAGQTAVTLFIVCGAVAAVALGASDLARRADAAPVPDAAPAIPVSVTPLQREDGYDLTRAFVGQVEAQSSARLSFELGGQLASITVDEGDTVQAGQTLATLDLSLLKAEEAQLLASKSATVARLTFAEQTLARSADLRTRGFESAARLDAAAAEVHELSARIAEIEAGLAAVGIRMSKSTIEAPFDARVTERMVDGGEAIGAGQPILGLVGTGAPLVRVGVPLTLDEASLAGARIEIDGQHMAADLMALRPDIDPVTRTRTAIFEIQELSSALFGQAARVLISERVEARGLWIPVTSLKEGGRGQWTVLTVDGDNTVQSAAVEILHAESERVFVRAGLPEGTLLINQGPQRITVGQTVDTAQAR